MTNALQQALHSTKVERDTIAARKAAEKAEHAALVAALHAAFTPYEAEVYGLTMTNTYAKHATVRELMTSSGANVYPIKRDDGLAVRVAAYPGESWLLVKYEPRKEAVAPSLRIYQGDSMYSSPRGSFLVTLDSFTPPDEVLSQFFAKLATFAVTA